MEQSKSLNVGESETVSVRSAASSHENDKPKEQLETLDLSTKKTVLSSTPTSTESLEKLPSSENLAVLEDKPVKEVQGTSKVENIVKGEEMSEDVQTYIDITNEAAAHLQKNRSEETENVSEQLSKEDFDNTSKVDENVSKNLIPTNSHGSSQQTRHESMSNMIQNLRVESPKPSTQEASTINNNDVPYYAQMGARPKSPKKNNKESKNYDQTIIPDAFTDLEETVRILNQASQTLPEPREEILQPDYKPINQNIYEEDTKIKSTLDNQETKVNEDVPVVTTKKVKNVIFDALEACQLTFKDGGLFDRSKSGTTAACNSTLDLLMPSSSLGSGLMFEQEAVRDNNHSEEEINNAACKPHAAMFDPAVWWGEPFHSQTVHTTQAGEQSSSATPIRQVSKKIWLSEQEKHSSPPAPVKFSYEPVYIMEQQCYNFPTVYTQDAGCCILCKARGAEFRYGILCCKVCELRFKATMISREPLMCLRSGENFILLDTKHLGVCRKCHFKACLTLGMNPSLMTKNQEELWADASFRIAAVEPVQLLMLMQFIYERTFEKGIRDSSVVSVPNLKMLQDQIEGDRRLNIFFFLDMMNSVHRTAVNYCEKIPCFADFGVNRHHLIDLAAVPLFLLENVLWIVTVTVASNEAQCKVTWEWCLAFFSKAYSCSGRRLILLPDGRLVDQEKLLWTFPPVMMIVSYLSQYFQTEQFDVEAAMLIRVSAIIIGRRGMPVSEELLMLRTKFAETIAYKVNHRIRHPSGMRMIEVIPELTRLSKASEGLLLDIKMEAIRYQVPIPSFLEA